MPTIEEITKRLSDTQGKFVPMAVADAGLTENLYRIFPDDLVVITERFNDYRKALTLAKQKGVDVETIKKSEDRAGSAILYLNKNQGTNFIL